MCSCLIPTDVRAFVRSDRGVSGRLHQGRTLLEIPRGAVIDCDSCRFAHLWPLPTELQSVQFHEQEFFDEIKPAYRDSHERDRSWWDFVQSSRLERLARHRGGQGRLLDIGSGFGDQIAQAMEMGWDARGIEPSSTAARWANENGRPTVCAPISDSTLKPLGKFEAIVFDQSIEHIVDPERAIASAARALVEGGLLLIVFANDFSPTQAAASLVTGSTGWWVAPREHVNYFSLKSMTGLVEAVGARVVDAVSTFPIDLFLGLGFNYVENRDLGRLLHERRMQLEFAFRDAGEFAALEEAYRGLARAGIGREIEVIAQVGDNTRNLR